MRTIATMGIADQQRAEHAAYRAALPAIVQAVCAGHDPVRLAALIARDSDQDERTVYGWITAVDHAIDRARRRAATLGVGPVWIGAIALVGAGLAMVFGWWGPPAIACVATVGAGSIGASVFVLRGLRLRTARRWLRDELADR